MPNPPDSKEAILAPPSACDVAAKKSIGLIDALLVSLGFTTSNLQHIITPMAAGGVGLTILGIGGIAAAIAILGVSTLLVTALIAYSVFKLIDQNTHESEESFNTLREIQTEKIEFFAHLLWWRHKSSNNFMNLLKTQLKLGQADALHLCQKVNEVYRGEHGFFHRMTVQEIEENIKDQKYSETIEAGLSYVTAMSKPRVKSWRPELMGLFAGFVTFISMNSGLIGAYSSIVTLIVSMSAVGLAIPILGWAIFAFSLIFAMGTAFLVRHYTDQSIKRQELEEDMQHQSSYLSKSIAALYKRMPTRDGAVELEPYVGGPLFHPRKLKRSNSSPGLRVEMKV